LRAFNVFVERSWLDPRAIKVRKQLFNLATAIEPLNDGVTYPMLMKEPRLGPLPGGDPNRSKHIDLFYRIREAPTHEAKVSALLAALDFGEAQPRPDSCRRAEYDRHRYDFSVRACAYFFLSVGRQDWFARFWELGSSLANLNDGVVRPFLQPPIRTRADGSNKWRGRCYVAMAADALMRVGMQRKEVAQRIVSTLREDLPVLVQRGKQKRLFEAVLSWRDQFHKGTPKNFEAKIRYEQYLEKCPKTTPAAKLRDFAVEALASAAAEARVISG
jgi:hypothetical protein